MTLVHIKSFIKVCFGEYLQAATVGTNSLIDFERISVTGLKIILPKKILHVYVKMAFFVN